ncbi:hypothetical protein [Clostridium sp. ZS2-4]|uniref:hypothetical protein n=1 Tax=Clostridium sp. ZS2-4 TaxID=2987703 RepID=UPI00227AD1D6|nr:hypothetical protein [Clostridium sp. ZS2-4]MCY6354357.1 hypothetical protein [Clostridium sp. ZS2-4]
MKKCFIISRIGEKNSEIRKDADKVLRHIIRPVTEQLNYEAIRADEQMNPNRISKSIIQSIIESDLVIADLTGHNPNVFYELAIRHTIGKPVIQIIKKGETIPFDINHIRTITYDFELDSVDEAKKYLKEYIENIENAEVSDNPVTDILKLDNISLLNTEDISVDSAINELASEIKKIPAYFNDLENRIAGRISQLVENANNTIATDSTLTAEEKMGMVAMEKILSNPAVGEKLFDELLKGTLHKKTKK